MDDHTGTREHGIVRLLASQAQLFWSTNEILSNRFHNRAQEPRALPQMVFEILVLALGARFKRVVMCVHKPPRRKGKYSTNL